MLSAAGSFQGGAEGLMYGRVTYSAARAALQSSGPLHATISLPQVPRMRSRCPQPCCCCRHNPAAVTCFATLINSCILCDAQVKARSISTPISVRPQPGKGYPHNPVCNNVASVPCSACLAGKHVHVQRCCCSISKKATSLSSQKLATTARMLADPQVPRSLPAHHVGECLPWPCWIYAAK